LTINGATIPGAFFALDNTVADAPGRQRLALITRHGDDEEQTTLRGFKEQVSEFATGLMTIGIKPGERVAIDLPNSPEWIISDLAITSIGAVTVPIYTTFGRDEKIFILKDSQASAIILRAEDKAGFKDELSKLQNVRHIISTGISPAEEGEEINDFSLHGVQLMGKVTKDTGKLKERVNAISPNDPFSIIYSSGTTGTPKGVLLSHANILSNINASHEVLDIRADDLYLSYLPLSHGFERMVHLLLILNTVPIAYSKGLTTVSSDLAFFKPTFMIGVPFFFEKIKRKIMARAAASGTIKRTLFRAAFAAKQGKEGGMGDKLVFSKIKEKIGPRLRYFVSGGAPLSTETSEFFARIGIPIIEGYGLTETSPVISVNTLENNKPGTVGRALPGTEVRLGDDNEILVKGPGVMLGYHNKTKATAETIKDGWLYTGDIGSIDKDGFITITDRKKDIIITSAGKNIAPQKIETILKADEYIKEALVFGNARTHIVALIVPAVERLDELKKIATAKDGPVFFTDPALHAFFEKKIKARLADLADYEHIKKFALIGDTLSIEAGEVTPTNKVKREKIGQRYSKVLEELYG
jgi:long-chain acyl-CoA synthetase